MIEALKSGNWLDRERVRNYGWLIAGLQLLSLVALLATSQGGRDRFGHLIGSDFLSFWAAGQVLDGGHLPYDAGLHLQAMQGFAPGLSGYPAFFYPPLFLLFCAALGLAPYFVALAGWLVATGTTYFAAVRAWAAGVDLRNPLPVWFVAFPPVLVTITHGQTSFLVAALLGSGLFLVKDRPWLAGFLLGLATIKPQLGLLVPIALILTGSWRTIISASLTTTAFALATTMLFGIEAWTQWYGLSGQATQAMENGAIGFGKMVSLFAALKLLGASTAIAYFAQSLFAIAAAAIVAVVSWRREWSPLIAATVLAAAPLATPFVLDYDMVLLAFPLIYLASSGYREWEKSVSALVFVAPVLARPLALFAQVPIMPLVLALLVWALWRRRMEDR